MKPENGSYQVRLSEIGNEAAPQSDDNEPDKYTTIQDAQQMRPTVSERKKHFNIKNTIFLVTDVFHLFHN